MIRQKDEMDRMANGEDGAAEMTDYPFANYTFKRFNAFNTG